MNEQFPTIDYARNRQALVQASKTRSWLRALASFYLTTLQRKNRRETALYFGFTHIASDNRRLPQFMKSLRLLTVVLDDQCQPSSTCFPQRLSKTYARNPKSSRTSGLGSRNREAAFKSITPAMLLTRYQKCLNAASAAPWSEVDPKTFAFNRSMSGSVGLHWNSHKFLAHAKSASNCRSICETFISFSRQPLT